MGASGSVAGTLTFATWKGRPYVRQTVTPSNPKSKGQIATRQMMKFLAQAWGLASMGGPGSPWDTLAKQMNVSDFNAFTSFNMKNWTQWKYPTENPEGTGLTPAVLGTLSPTGGVREINLSHVITTINDAFGITYYINDSANPATARQNAALTVYIGNNGSGDTVKSVITGLAPGSYYVGYQGFAQDGTTSAVVEDATPITVS